MARGGGRGGPAARKRDARQDRRAEARRDRRQEAEADRDARRPGHPPGSGGTTGGGSGPPAPRDGAGGTSGSPDFTSATTTAPEPDTETADDAEAFFSSGHGTAMHYDRTEQQATADNTAGG